MTPHNRLLVRVSLIGGIVSSVLYAAMNLCVPMLWEGL
jgi:hypothetical protein